MVERRDRSPRQVDTKSEPTEPTQQGAIAYIYTKRAVYGNEAENSEQVRVPVFSCDPARVRVGGAATKNLGDFNSAKVEVSIDLPCLPELSELIRAYQITSDLVDQMVRNELSMATTGEVLEVSTAKMAAAEISGS